MRENVTRRTVIFASAAAITGTGALAYTQTAPAAALTVSGLDVSDTTRTLGPDGEITAVELDVSIDYEYDSSHQPDAVTLTLYVAPSGGSYTELDHLSLADPSMADSGTVSLSGDLTALDAWTLSDFDAAEGATNSVTIDIKAVLKLQRDGKTIGVADVGDEAVVTVGREEMSVSASIAGSGSLTVVSS